MKQRSVMQDYTLKLERTSAILWVFTSPSLMFSGATDMHPQIKKLEQHIE